MYFASSLLYLVQMKKGRKYLRDYFYSLKNILSLMFLIKLFRVINGKRDIIIPLCNFHSKATSTLRVTIVKIKSFGNLAGIISLIKM